MTGGRYLSSGEVISEARRLGIEVSERTLRYYVSLGLLPKPGRHPSEGVDQRVLFFPGEILEQLEEIRRLKDSGFTLDQIRQFVAGTARAGLETLAGTPEPDGSQLAEKVVRALSSEQVRQAYRDFVSRAEGASEEGLRDLARDFYRRVLSTLVGPEEAERTVARAFRRLSAAQWERKLAPLRRIRDTFLEAPPRPGGSALGRTMTSTIRDLARRLRAGEGAEALEGELDHTSGRIAALIAKYQGVPPSNPQKYEIARFMGRALEVYAEALSLLREGMHSGEPAPVEQAVARAERAGEILAHLENMVSEKRELLRLCQEEELRLP